MFEGGPGLLGLDQAGPRRGTHGTVSQLEANHHVLGDYPSTVREGRGRRSFRSIIILYGSSLARRRSLIMKAIAPPPLLPL